VATRRTVDPDEELGDDADLERFGYSQKLNRTIGAFTSFCVAFSMVSVTTAVFTLFGYPFQQIGGVGIWLWVPATAGGLVIASVYAHLAARVPVTGYAYQWSSRLINPHVGWFTGWFVLCTAFVGTASLAVAFASVFTAEVFQDPTHRDIELVGAVAVLAAVAINAAGVRRATFMNNLGATTELVGTLGVAAIVAVGLFFFDHTAGPSIFFDTTPVGGGHIDLTAIGLAALLPVTTLIGWEGAADLAEETKDPRKTAPRAMVRAVALSGTAGFAIFGIFSMAIPHGASALINRPENPLFALLDDRFGQLFADLVKAVVFVSIFACLLANLTVATRTAYALARDRMLPGSRVFSKVNERTRVPLNALVLVGAVAFGLNFLSAGIASKIFAMTAVMAYGTYLLMMIVVRVARRRGTLGAAPPGHFDLGRALNVFTLIGIVWCSMVVAYQTLPSVNHIAAEYAGAAVAIGALAWVFVIRGRVERGEAGPPRANAQSLHASDKGVPVEHHVQQQHVIPEATK
jgi:amino acid transporter